MAHNHLVMFYHIFISKHDTPISICIDCFRLSSSSEDMKKLHNNINNKNAIGFTHKYDAIMNL